MYHYIGSEKKKKNYLGVNLIEHVQNVYTKKYKMLMKEILKI